MVNRERVAGENLDGSALAALKAFAVTFQTGLLAVDGERNVVCINDNAGKLIAEGLFDVEGSRVRIPDLAAQRAFTVSLTLALDGDDNAPPVWLCDGRKKRRSLLLFKPLLMFDMRFVLVWATDISRPRDGALNLSGVADLTTRETEMISLLTLGMDVHSISTRMNVAIPTVRTHLQNAFSKLEVDGQVQLVRMTLAASSL